MYYVDNAIIMAAGYSKRCLPLSEYMPKGLFVIKGEVLIERQINQLKQAGVSEIIVVVGYCKKQFEYLIEKYGVTIIENPEFETKNNISSLYYARNKMKNTYICCADNYFTTNVFSAYVENAYYSCKYTEQPLEEYYALSNEGGVITEIYTGGEKGWYTMGEAFFTKDISERFVYYLEKEYQEEKTGSMTWDDFHAKHIDELPLYKMERRNDEVYEFDTIEDILKFDNDFIKFIDKYKDME